MRGKSTHAIAKEGSTDLLAMGWKNRKVISIIATCGITLEGTLQKRKDETKIEIFSIKQSSGLDYMKLISMGQQVIHNHLRQDGLALETIWNMYSWDSNDCILIRYCGDKFLPCVPIF